MSPGFLTCFWMLSVEPTDRALAGWCPLEPSSMPSPEAAARFLDRQRDSGGAVYGVSWQP